LRTSPKIGQKYTLTGPNNVYANCIVQQIEAVPHAGLTTITFGPTANVVMETWIELARASRERTTWNFPSGRGDGGTSAAQAASGNGDGQPPSDDTAHGVGGDKYSSVLHQQV
jgi:hypothetical protein